MLKEIEVVCEFRQVNWLNEIFNMMKNTEVRILRENSDELSLCLLKRRFHEIFKKRVPVVSPSASLIFNFNSSTIFV